MVNMRKECEQILDAAHQQNIMLRVIGGMAIHLHAPVASELPALKRAYGDLDFVTTARDGQRMRAFFESIHFIPNTRFNALQGKSRMIFNSPDDSWYVDIFIDEFRMCHIIKFAEDRLEKDPVTIPLAELFLTKLQIVQINQKDVKDIAAMLLEHPIGSTDQETVNADRILQVSSQDWGFYTSVRKNMDRIPGFIEAFDLSAEQRDLVLGRLGELAERMDRAPKSTAWKLRAKVGERVRWYEEPEDATRDAISMKLE